MDYERKVLFMDMIQMLLSSARLLNEEKELRKEEFDAICRSLGSIKNVIYSKDEFRQTYKAYCNKHVRLLG